MRESNEARWSRNMGQESSRPGAAEDSIRTPHKSTATGSKMTAPSNTSVKIAPAPQQSNGTLGSSIPLKRANEERDEEGDTLRTSLRDKFVRTSPGNPWQAFVPDRRDHRSPPFRSGADVESLSPGYRRRSDRGDYWSPHDHHSSPPRRTSPLRRGSLVRNGSPEYVEWPRSLPKSSPTRSSHPDLDRNESESRNAQNFRNLTWKAPDLDSRPIAHTPKLKLQPLSERKSSNISNPSIEPRMSDTASAKVDYNGLKGVPTGPKQAPVPGKADRAKIPNQSLPPVSLQVRLRPHIFISAEHVPPILKTRTHLHKYFRSFIPREQDICVDDSGWYLCFPETDSGRRTLATCFKKHHQAQLFSSYTMHMECFPNGHSQSTFGSKSNVDALLHPHEGHVVSTVDMASTAQTSLDDLGLSPGTNSPTNDKSSISHAIELPASFAASNSALTSPLPSQVAIYHLRRSSPLGVPSRQERDETSSSISGITGSDVSASKRLNCHVCKTASIFETDPLIHCSSCVRRYHRRCHPRSSIPADLEREHHWQCRRCVKKQIPPKSRLSNTLPDADFSPAASVGQPDEPAPERLRIDVSPPGPYQDSISPANGLDDSANHKLRDLTENHRFEGDQELSDADDTYEPAEMPLVTSDENNFSEANDLVAKSFAHIEALNQRPATTPTKAGKLNLIRKKIPRATEIATPETVHLQSISTPSTSAKTPVPQRSRLNEAVPAQIAAIDTPNQQKKPHRWSGGGADKDIIKAGISNLFPEHQSPPRGNTASLSTVPNAKATFDSSAVPEIAESPLEPSELRSEAHNGTERREMRISEKAVATSVVNAKLPESDFSQTSQIPAPSVKQRMKPRTPAISHCVNCGKKIASGPSGANIYCSACKKETAKKSMARHMTSESDGSKTRNLARVDLEVDEAIRAASDVAGRHSINASPSLVQNHEAEPPVDINLGTDAERAPCAMSGSFYEQHDPSITTPVPNQALENARAAVAEEEGDKNGSEADLDFWKAKSPSRPDVDNIDSRAWLDNEALGNGDEMDIDVNVSRGDEETPQESDLDESQREDAAVSPQSKRRSQTRPAKNTYDLGDSFTRPPNTYVKLIGLALSTAPGHRMKGNDIVQWVIKNVPTYKAKEGKWENSLRATMTLKRAGYAGNEGLWKIVDNGAKKNEGFVYELLPGKAETMLHWDPVLQQPISPPKGWRTESNERRGDVTNAADRSQHEGTHSSESHGKSSSRRRQHDLERAERKRLTSLHREQMQLDTPDESISAGTEMDQSMEDVDDSSSSEPIASRRHKASQASSGANGPSIARDAGDMMAIPSMPGTNIAEGLQQGVPSLKQQNTTEKQCSPTRSRKVTLEDMIAWEAKTINYNAKSLYDEWPEYDPKNEFDREAKIAEIKARPTRKQKFGKQCNSIEMETPGPISRYVFGENATLPERPKRSKRPAAYPWEAEEENVIECDSIAELFNVPANPIAFIHDGEIAYRDGSKNHSRVIYKSSYS